jgi:hypothetical protein
VDYRRKPRNCDKINFPARIPQSGTSEYVDVVPTNGPVRRDSMDASSCSCEAMSSSDSSNSGDFKYQHGGGANLCGCFHSEGSSWGLKYFSLFAV